MIVKSQRRTKGIPFLSASFFYRVVFLGGLFTEVERAVPTLPEKQNDFAVRFQRTFQLSTRSRFSPRLKSFQS